MVHLADVQSVLFRNLGIPPSVYSVPTGIRQSIRTLLKCFSVSTEMQSLHRVRERWVMRRTSIVNQIRGLLLELGITLQKGRRHVDTALPNVARYNLRRTG